MKGKKSGILYTRKQFDKECKSPAFDNPLASAENRAILLLSNKREAIGMKYARRDEQLSAMIRMMKEEFDR